MNKAKLENVIDNSLTPKTAKGKGYEYIEDVFNPYVAIQDVLAFAEEQGYKFGNPGGRVDSEQRFGLYRPIKTRDESD